MENTRIRKYCFESTHAPYSVRNIEVSKLTDKLVYEADDVVNTIDIIRQTLVRKNSEMEMLFDFSNMTGYVKLADIGRTLPFEITDADFKVEGEIIHLDFKYIIDQEMFVSISII